jgi:hypothetical protein
MTYAGVPSKSQLITAVVEAYRQRLFNERQDKVLLSARATNRKMKLALACKTKASSKITPQRWCGYLREARCKSSSRMIR